MEKKGHHVIKLHKVAYYTNDALCYSLIRRNGMIDIESNEMIKINPNRNNRTWSVARD